MNNSDLHNKNKKLGFKIPENYFEELEGRVTPKLKPDKPVKSLFFRKQIVPILALAASILLFVGVVYIQFTKVSLDENYADLEYLFEEEANEDLEEFTLLDVYVLDEEKLENNNVYQKIMFED